jgi:acyl carrier protein
VDSNITGRVLAVIAKTQHISIETVKPENTFEELKIDSLDGLQIVFALEDEFDVSIPDDEARNLTSVTQVIAGIASLLAKKAA